MSHLSRTLTILGFAVASLASLPGCSNSQEASAPPAAAQLKKQQSESFFRFIVLSDRTGGHIPGEFEKAITEIASLKPDFVINVGDLIEGYTDNEKELIQQWQEVDGMIAKLGVPFLFV